MRTTDGNVVLGLYRSGHPHDVLEAAADLGVAHLDTASNYLRHRSHEVLKTQAGDLLPNFTISTKVGYFPGEHSLDPARLRAGVERAAKELGREPDAVLLHNPEHSHPDAEMLAQACAVLAGAAQAGLCGRWGVSSWNPRPLVGLDTPCPDVLMVRSGLLVGVDVLEAAEAIVTRWRPSQVWGMSPFGGSANEAVWGKFDPRIFLRDALSATRVQAAFRSAYGLPRVDAVAVGTDNVEHLRELVGALAYEVDDQVVQEYRQLLRARRQPV
ncbi:aldo/keto reductase [Streptomyces sp. NBC_01591]|uniref:aldo/keto reductase n=1 Tax=Streptomyces sp. NBC_01591 TaxID=2975888 RepID=UPI002DD938AD|nr:aldo/keto reductase [Streptomyces sp. NBC_01591]WSD69051.1 aldo/keto reductase [Streptomyces sp. NBC_01591]